MVAIEVCVGSSCYVKGSNQLVTIIKELIKENNWEDKTELKGAFCMQMCSFGLGVKVNGKALEHLGLHNAKEEIYKAIKEVL